MPLASANGIHHAAIIGIGEVKKFLVAQQIELVRQFLCGADDSARLHRIGEADEPVARLA
jgi:hypothetical protein